MKANATMHHTKELAFESDVREWRFGAIIATMRQWAPFRTIRSRNGWLFLPVFLACAICFWFVPHVGVMPGSDYWGVLGKLIGTHGLQLTLHGLYAQDNEHIIAIPTLIYVVNVLITHGNNEALTAIACGMSLLIGLMLASSLLRALSTETIRHPIPLLLVTGIFAGAAAFTPLAVHNFFEGMSGVAWICTNLLVISAFYLQYRFPDSYKALAVSVILAVLAAQSYSTGVPVLILIGLQLAFQQGIRRRGMIVSAFGLALLAAVYFHQTVPKANGHHVFSPVLLGEFESMFIGGGLTTQPDVAFALGVLGLLLFAWLVATAFRRRLALSSAQAFWVTLGGYAITAGLMAGIGRIDVFGLADAISSRYATLPALFWVSLAGLLLTATAFADGTSFKARARTVAISGCAAFILMLVSSYRNVMAYFSRVVYRPGATLSVFVGADDMKLIHDTITPAPTQLTDLRSKLQAMGHIPFNGHFDRCPKLGSHLSIDTTTHSAEGFIDSGNRLHGNNAYIKLHGWVAHGDGTSYARLLGKPQCIAIVDSAGTVEGLGIAGLPRPDVAASLHSNDSGFGWIGYALCPKNDATLMAYARDQNGHWVSLSQAAYVSNNTVAVR